MEPVRDRTRDGQRDLMMIPDMSDRFGKTPVVPAQAWTQRRPSNDTGARAKRVRFRGNDDIQYRRVAPIHNAQQVETAHAG
jgi:hypothetical protein